LYNIGAVFDQLARENLFDKYLCRAA